MRQSSCPKAWCDFVALYGPLLHYWARHVACTREEAEDLVQDVFATLVTKLPQFSYDSRKTFRGWLRTVALNRWKDLRRRTARVAHGLDGAAVVDTDADPAEQFWQHEYRGLLLQRALNLMKTDFPNSWEACYQVLVDGRPIPEVAAEHAMTANALHQAKFRMIKRLRQELAGMLD